MKIQPGVGYNFDSSSHGFTLDTSDPFPASTNSSPDHPFKVKIVAVVSGAIRFQVITGTLNNLVPEMDDVIGGVEKLLDSTTSGVPTPPTNVLTFNTSTKESWVYLRAGPEAASPYAFPDPSISNTPYPKVISSNVELTDTDTNGYVLLAKVDVDNVTAPTVWTLHQYVNGSLWGDRVKVNGATAKYYYARI
jgi:hypothetical protein